MQWQIGVSFHFSLSVLSSFQLWFSLASRRRLYHEFVPTRSLSMELYRQGISSSPLLGDWRPFIFEEKICVHLKLSKLNINEKYEPSQNRGPVGKALPGWSPLFVLFLVVPIFLVVNYNIAESFVKCLLLDFPSSSFVWLYYMFWRLLYDLQLVNNVTLRIFHFVYLVVQISMFI